MSGEPPIVNLVGAELGRLIAAAGNVFAVAEHELAVIGGLAVMCRCRSAARATADIDAVTGPDGTVGIVSDLGAGKLSKGFGRKNRQRHETTVTNENGPVHIVVEDEHLYIDGVKVDVIDTQPLAPTDLDGLADKQQLFLAAHRWALESARLVVVRVASGSQGMATAKYEEVGLTVAMPAALVAMKLHSIEDRNSRSHKGASDTEDLYRLIDEHNSEGQLAVEIAQAPYGLPRLVCGAARRIFIDGGLARRRSLKSAGGASATAIDLDDLQLVTTEFVNGLDSLMGT